MAAEDFRLPVFSGFWGDEYTLKREKKANQDFPNTLRVKQVKIKVMCYFSISPLLLFSLLCTADYTTTRSEWTISRLIILVTPAHNEIFIPCLQQPLAETVLLFLN